MNVINADRLLRITLKHDTDWFLETVFKSEVRLKVPNLFCASDTHSDNQALSRG